jgi:ABC-type dipeptide/oligopeptide/nickel transport system ATPase component
MLKLVGIPDPASRMNEYPHRFSPAVSASA